MRKLLQGIVNRFGYQVAYVGRGRRLPPDPLNSFFMALQRLGFDPRHIVDIGANRGAWSRTAARYFPGACYTLVEPQARFQSRTKDLEAAGIRLRWMPVGAGDRRSRMTLTVPECDTSATFAPDAISAKAEGCSRFEVDVLPLDEMLADDSWPIPDMIKIDAEGLDLRVLDGAKSFHGRTELFLLEAAMFDDRAENTLLHLLQAMDRIGYQPLDITDLNRCAGSGVLWLCEMAFVRKNGILRSKIPPYRASFQPD